MIFKCPNCGYENELNSTGKCEACPNFVIPEKIIEGFGS